MLRHIVSHCKITKKAFIQIIKFQKSINGLFPDFVIAYPKMRVCKDT